MEKRGLSPFRGLGHNPPMAASPTIGVTLGDPAGVGPEVLDAALSTTDLPGETRLYGPEPLVLDLAGRHGTTSPRPTSPGLDGVTTGRYSKASGKAAVAALQAAVGDLAAGRLAALVTGPISKVSLGEAGLSFPGQTEMVAHATGASRFAMMLAGPRLRVTLATTHVAIRDLSGALTEGAIRDAVELTHEFLLDRLRIGEPRIGVLGLNPHASDEGRFGNEETILIEPTVQALCDRGIRASGPLPADTAFHRAVQGEFHAVVAMYHDQGLGPLKLYHFADAINITLGPAAVRCSPDHGPAFDIAGKGLADPTSMVEALRFAASTIG